MTEDKRVWVGDIETNGFDFDNSIIHCAVFKQLETEEVRKFTPCDIHQLPKWMEDNVDTLIGHNFISFDLPIIHKVLGYEYKGEIIDTLIMSRMLNPNRTNYVKNPITNKVASPNGLEAWGTRLGRYKPSYEQWETYDRDMLHRCTEDVEINLLTYKALEQELTEDWEQPIEMSMHLFSLFQKIEEYGWKVDQPYMHSLVKQLDTMQGEILALVKNDLPWVIEDQGVVNKPYTKAGKMNATLVKWYESRELTFPPIAGPYTRVEFRRVDLNKRAEIIPLLLAGGWKPEAYNFNDEGEKTSPKLAVTDPFDGMTTDLGKNCATFIQIRHRKSLIEGLLKLVRPDGRISSVISGLADTARVKHKGIVNIPNPDAFFGSEIRKIFIADDDRVLVGVDSAGNQLRQLSALMGDESFEHAVVHGNSDDGTDMHTLNQKAAGLAKRSQAKTFIYGFLFGAGDAKIGSIVGGGAAQGKQLKADFLAGLPKLATLIDTLKTEWRKSASKRTNKWGGLEWYNGTVKGLDGRPMPIKSEHAILVYVLQNMEAIQMQYALLFSYKWLNEKGLTWGEDYGVVCFYHDEINTECKPEYKEIVGETVKKAIIYAGKYLGIKTPHDGDIKIGKDWLEVH